jgi:superfamily II DNA helicase RecQ
MPQTLEDLKKVAGFGYVKCQKYGDAILEIVKKYI